MNNVDATLYRPIKKGDQYNKYFAGSGCEVQYLGKGDTSFHVKKMKLWANKHAHHTKKIALAEFGGKSLAETAKSIHQFLFWHLQYKMDGIDQNLKSPGCAWSTREIGLDCKSYSIFASTILKNLGIKHYFRKVKQPFFEPKLWSHVYVVIPKDQKNLRMPSKADYYVIDATVEDNNEVMFSQFKDELMSKVSLPAYGLAAPGALAGCSCTQKSIPRSITTSVPVTRSQSIFSSGDSRLKSFASKPMLALRGLGASSEEQSQMLKALDKFELFLAELVVNKGLPASAANIAKERLVKFIKIGVEPTILDLFAIPISKADAKGLGFSISDITAPVLTDINQLPSSTGIFNNRGNSNTGFLQDAAGVAKEASGIASIISSIIPSAIVSKTFGQVFANGLNFKCWGSSWTPQRAQSEIPQFIAELERNLKSALSVSKNQLESSINSFFKNYPIGVTNTTTNGTHTLEQWIGWLNDTAKDCTKDGLKALDAGIDNWLQTIEDMLPQIGRQLGVNITAIPTRVTFYRERSSKSKPFEKIVPQVRVTVLQTPTNPITTNTGTGLITSNSFVDQNGKVVLDNQNEPKSSLASMGWIAGGALALIAIGTIVTGDNPITITKKS